MTAFTASALVFIDRSVEDYQGLASHVLSDCSVVVLDSDRPAIDQITETLARYRSLKSIHIVSHGNPGRLEFSYNPVDARGLVQVADQLQQWSNSFAANAEILLYGCCVAAEQLGREFVQTLQSMTGLAVAASQSFVGHASRGGGWQLNTRSAQRRTALAFDADTLATYPGLFATQLLSETFAEDEVEELVWRFGTGSTSSANPFLTASSSPTVPEGGIPGTATPLDQPGKGALRLTSNANNQSAFVLYNGQAIPFNAGLDITFELFAYNTTTTEGADGISFFLIDGAETPTTAGGFGGSLGYANINPANPSLPRKDGIKGGYIGIGFDEFGNFSNPAQEAGINEGRVGGPGRIQDSVAIRGSEANQYRYLTGTDDLGSLDNPSVTQRDAAERKTRIVLSRDGLLDVYLDLNQDGDLEDPGELIINSYDVVTNNGQAPETFKFGFAASTGGSTNIHEIRNLEINTLTFDPIVTNAQIQVNPSESKRIDGVSAVDDPRDVATGGFINFVALLDLPDPTDGTLYIGDPNAGGQAITALPDVSRVIGAGVPFKRLTVDELDNLYFQATDTFNGRNSGAIQLNYTAADNLNALPENEGVITILPTGVFAPEVTDASLNIGAGQTRRIPGLSATDEDGTVTLVALLDLPRPSDGTLFIGDPTAGGQAITALTDTDPNISDPFYRLTVDQLSNLYFQASPTFEADTPAGAIERQFVIDYTALDNDGLVAADLGQITITPSTGAQFDPDCFDKPIDRFRGTSGGDVQRGDEDNTTTRRDRMLGLAGNDLLRGLDCPDTLLGGTGRDRLLGGNSSDRLRGNQGRDNLSGNAGDDIIGGGLGVDQINGGAGADTIRTGRANDRALGGKSADIIRGNEGDDRLGGNGGSDSLGGGQGADFMRGGPGNDLILGNQGADFMTGGNGTDILRAGLGDDTAKGGAQRDLIRGGRGNDLVSGLGGSDQVRGNDGNDTARGGGGQDFVSGDAGNDRVNGGAGQDTLFGGAGDDIMRGKGGADVFVYSNPYEGTDRILGFNARRDAIEVKAIFAKARFGSANPFQSYIRVAQVGSDTAVRIDANGDRAGRRFQTLALLVDVNANTIGASNFIVS